MIEQLNTSQLSPIARDILCVLEEAGEEDMGCVINTVLTHRDARHNIDWLVKIVDLLEKLLIKEYIEILISNKILSKANAQNFKDFRFDSSFYFDETKQVWVWSKEKTEFDEIPNIIITPKGLEFISKILREQGWPSTLS